jgi:hypothetical protein
MTFTNSMYRLNSREKLLHLPEIYSIITKMNTN